VKVSAKVLFLLLCLGNCGASAPGGQSILSDMTPEAWREPRVWHFFVTDEQERQLGSIALLLTKEGVGPDTCVDSYWRKAIVMESTLDFDFGVDISPAYHLNGPWLTVELTAASCSLNHRLIGDADNDGASGSFHYIHSLNATIIGSFYAKPTLERK
jgi:hypothetical protein